MFIYDNLQLVFQRYSCTCFTAIQQMAPYVYGIRCTYSRADLEMHLCPNFVPQSKVPRSALVAVCQLAEQGADNAILVFCAKCFYRNKTVYFHLNVSASSIKIQVFKTLSILCKHFHFVSKGHDYKSVDNHVF